MFVRSDGKKRKFYKMFEKPVEKYDRAWANVLFWTNNDAVRTEVPALLSLNVFTIGAVLLLKYKVHVCN